MDENPAIRFSAAGRRPWARSACAVLALLVAGGCTTSLRQWWHNGWKVGPNYCPPQAAVSRQWLDAADQRLQATSADDQAWWTVFSDPALDRLVQSAYRQNLDLKTAGTRILASRAERGIAVGNLFPQRQTAVADYVHAQIPSGSGFPLPIPSPLNLWATGFNASWELDFWGRFRRAIESADANLGASIEAYHDAVLLLVSEVATNYVQLRTYEQRLEFARRNVEIQVGSLGLAEDRFHNGVVSELDVRQARSNLAQTRALIPPLEAGRRQAGNRLCILLGVPVEDLARQLEPAPIPQPPLTVAVGIPADLLRRRPDIRRAERLVAAQSAQIGIAEAQLYPQFAINGFIGYAANDLADLFNSKSFVGFIIPTFSWNVLNYGRIRNNVREQQAMLQETVFQYQQTVLTAGREVEDALVGFLQARQQAEFLESGVGEAERSVELVTLQYRGGIVDFNRVFTTQQLLVQQQDQLASTRGNIALNLVQVYRALGGGWRAFEHGGQAQAAVAPASALPPLPAAEPVAPPGPTVPPVPPPPAAAAPAPGTGPILNVRATSVGRQVEHVAERPVR
jgi:NodT family efflux transporter outer membrane factor (OMF) lipoprotein